jgi:AcrR family transcriptional regulator
MTPEEAPHATKDRIMEAAEALFIERGFAATSLRAVTGMAGVNLAAVHYHFGSKEELFADVFHRRIAPVNQERLKRLDRLKARVGARASSVEEILEALLAPVLLQGVHPLIGRLYGEPPKMVQSIIEREFGALVRRFLAALSEALPEIPPEELSRRFQFIIGAMIHAVSFPDPTFLLPEAPSPSESLPLLLERLVRFAASGLRAGPTLQAQP